MNTLRYLINKLSEGDRSYTIDLLVDEIVRLEKELDEANSCVNQLNSDNRKLKAEIKKLSTVDFNVTVGSITSKNNEPWERF